MKEIPALESRRVRTQPRTMIGASSGAWPPRISRTLSICISPKSTIFRRNPGAAVDRAPDAHHTCRRGRTMAQTVYAKALTRAAEILGGRDKLRDLLHVPMRALDKWLDGTEEPPMDIFLKAVDVISGRSEPKGRSEAVQRSRRLQRDATALRSAAKRAIEGSRQVWAAVLAGREAATSARTPRSLAEFLEARFEPTEGRAMVEFALDAALSATAAPMGKVQLAYPEGLRIVAHRGFEQPFLDFFACIASGDSACALAMKQGARVVVPDVAKDPVYAGTPAGAIMEQAHTRAVQATPLFAAPGEVPGVLSTHFDHPHVPSQPELEAIDQ